MCVCVCIYSFIVVCMGVCVGGVVYVSWCVAWRPEENWFTSCGTGSFLPPLHWIWIELRLLTLPPTGPSCQSQETAYSFKLRNHCVTIGIKKPE